jgi:RHS repeat-associated protein
MYKYNGKELQNEFGVNFYDFGARNYMPDLGRWSNMDPLSEKYYKSSNYHYAANNPVFYIDPDGMRIDVSGILARNKDGEYKNKELAEAFLTFANSDFGREILGMFADAGQKIEGTDIEFGESGIFAQQGLDLHVDMSSQNHTKGNDDERQTDTGANGSTAFSFNTKTGRGAVAIYMNSDLNTGSNEYAKAFKENPNDPDARQLFILSRTGTLFHEATIHVIPRTQDFFDDCNVNSSNIIQSILNQTRSVSRQDHLQAREEGSMFRTRAIPAMQQLHREKKTGLSNKKVESIMLNYSNQ